MKFLALSFFLLTLLGCREEKPIQGKAAYDVPMKDHTDNIVRDLKGNPLKCENVELPKAVREAYRDFEAVCERHNFSADFAVLRLRYPDGFLLMAARMGHYEEPTEEGKFAQRYLTQMTYWNPHEDRRLKRAWDEF